jgi:hypothetical protein
VTSAAVATWGLHQVQQRGQANQTTQQLAQVHQQLAQQSGRKLALLVGVNAYPSPIRDLRGCLTDVEMQYELLVHRYGFRPADIVIVSDRDLGLGGTWFGTPTRHNVLTAFETHLLTARSEDVVLFHYSGHGSYVREPNGIPEFNGFNGTLVPYDGRPDDRDEVDDITGKTLFLLTSALATDRVTLILDSCHSGGGIRGNAIIRALSNSNAAPSERERAYQDRWMTNLGWDESSLLARRRQGIAKGVALGSAQIDQLAADAAFSGFHAGAFTYMLTRYLWQLPTTQPLESTFANLARSTRNLRQPSQAPQDPIYATAPGSRWATAPLYLLPPTRPTAEAVIRRVNGNQVTFWLGGISDGGLATQATTRFDVLDAQGQVIGEVQQTSRQGLVGIGTLQPGNRASLQPGQLLRERIRGLPANLSLSLGLEPSLGEGRSTAQTALSRIERIDPVAVNQSRPVDYLFGRLTENVRSQARQRGVSLTASLNSLGLMGANLTPVPDSFGPAQESVTTAVNRLRPRLKMLLAGKVLAGLVNSQVSTLNVDVTVVPVASQGILVSRSSRSAQASGSGFQVASGGSQRLRAGTEIAIEVRNNEAQRLYLSAMVIASTGELVILHPVTWDAPEEAAQISPRQTLRVPASTGGPEDFRFVVGGPSGFLELLVLTSALPLRNTLRGLQTIARGRNTRSGNPLAFNGVSRGAAEDENTPLAVVDTLLEDVSRGVGIEGRDRAVSTDQFAAFSMMIEVVD